MTKFTVISAEHPNPGFAIGNIMETLAAKPVPVLVEGEEGIPIIIERFILDRDGLSFELPADQCPDVSLSPRLTLWNLDEGYSELAVKFYAPLDTSEGKLLLDGLEIPIQWFEVRSDLDVFDPILTLAISASEEAMLKLLRQIKPQAFSVVSSQHHVVELGDMQIGGLDVSVAGGKTRVLMFSRVKT